MYFYIDSLDEDSCECEVPCYQIKYNTEVSYSKFPDPGMAQENVLKGYYDDVQYQRYMFLSFRKPYELF